MDKNIPSEGSLEKELEQPPLFTLKSLEQVRVLANPLRIRIMELLAQKPMTARQVAQCLKDKPSDLYYHFQELERVGLIRLVRTQPKGNVLEKYYQTVAKDFTYDPSLFQLHKDAFRETITAFTSTIYQELLESLDKGLLRPGDPERHVAIYDHLRGKPEELQKFARELRALLKRYEHLRARKKGDEYCLALYFFPTTRSHSNSEKPVKKKKESKSREGKSPNLA